jgi:hypothetical protein
MVAGGDAAEVLQAAERSFDASALAIAPHIIADRSLAILPAWDDRPGAGGLEAAAQVIGVLALISNETRQRPGVGEHFVGCLDIANIAGGGCLIACRPACSDEFGLGMKTRRLCLSADGKVAVEYRSEHTEC